MSSDPTKTQLAEAKTLIQEKRYVDARKLLKSINDPVARQWEAKLDSIAPVAAAAPRSSINYVVVGLIAGVIGLLIGLVIGSSLGNRPTQTSSAGQADYSKITDVKTALAGYCDLMKLMPDCSQWVDNTLSNHLETARQCLTTVDWERNTEPFGQCLLDNKVPLYLTSAPSNIQLTATMIVATNDAVSKLLDATATAAANSP